MQDNRSAYLHIQQYNATCIYMFMKNLVLLKEPLPSGGLVETKLDNYYDSLSLCPFRYLFHNFLEMPTNVTH
jgi:hypothetical protein